jgi:hypothetical protein
MEILLDLIHLSRLFATPFSGRQAGLELCGAEPVHFGTLVDQSFNRLTVWT